MTPSERLACDAEAAATARAALDEAAAVVEAAAAALRAVLAALVALWPTSAWVAAGAHSPTAWLRSATSLSPVEAHRLTRVARLCHRFPAFGDAVLGGTLSLGRADVLARAATRERQRLLDPSLDALLRLGATCVDDDDFAHAVAYWSERADEHLRPVLGPGHRLTLTPRLFGGGELHGELTPSAFATVSAAIDAWIQDPDPAHAPHRRTLAERRADALDDLAHHALRGPGGPTDPDDLDPDDTFDGITPDDVHRQQHVAAEAGVDLDHLGAWRRALAEQLAAPRRRPARRTKARSGATVNVVCDVRALARDQLPLDDPDLFAGHAARTDHGWRLARGGVERLLCDSALVATLFSGPTGVLDATAATEHFTGAQRRAIAARDAHCVFPSCRRPPRRCDVHHLEWRSQGGATSVDNGALCCRFHHRLIHEHRWRLHRDDTGAWVAIDPHGEHHREQPPPARRAP